VLLWSATARHGSRLPSFAGGVAGVSRGFLLDLACSIAHRLLSGRTLFFKRFLRRCGGCMSFALSLIPQLFGNPSFVALRPANVSRGTHGHPGRALLDDRRIVEPWPLQELGGHRAPRTAGRAQPLTETSIFESAH
jgi:hypothetical protein